ncbi:MAG: RDD family protein, partial [Trebonia sp.]
HGVRMGRVTGSWLEGPGAAQRIADPSAYPGKRHGLPASGAGSVAGFGRRLGALFIDWIIALLIAGAVTRHAAFDAQHPVALWVPSVVLAVEYIVLLGSAGATIGMRLCGIGVRSLGGGRLRLGWVVVRTVLLLVVVPAVVYDRDQRGLHDKASGAIAVRL